MDEMEKILRLLADMESFSHHDKLSETIKETVGHGDDELSEWDLDLVSAAEAQAYQRFLRRLDGQDTR